MNKMNSGELSAYLYGAAEMAARLFDRMGDSERADCIIDWIVNRDNLRETHEALLGNPELWAAATLEVLMIRHCGPYE